MSAPAWDVALRRELVAAAGRRRSRRRGPIQVTVAAGALLTAAAVALRPAPAEAEVRVERAGDRIVVTLVELEQHPDDVEAQLQAEGLDVVVEAVATGPSAVGRFVGAASQGEHPLQVVPLDGTGTSYTAFALPAGWDGSLRLFMGRPPRAGEGYVAFTDAFAPGEPLACLPLEGERAADVAARLDDHRGVTFRRLDTPAAAALAVDDLRGAFAAWTVHRADATAADAVVVWLAPPGTTPWQRTGGPLACGP